MSGNEKTSSGPTATTTTRAVASGSNSERRNGSTGRQVERLNDRLRALEEEHHVAKRDFCKSLHEINKLMTEIRHHFHFHFLHHQSRVGVVHRLHQHGIGIGIGRGRAAGSGKAQTGAVVMIRDLRAAREEGSNIAAVCQ
ncbi:uncharacterized protein LOC127789827 [Diospyros lotus]|uniref:uncharacterized protein LOC127789827 n=1 Tax=Diospyros lotus TaxID=55363 RepID=UPI0022514863|nr:uncharacterized protein LOC127789827 [Diospyros lotus]XP_052174801.1 uncharacterized protein LOC127789827 [Diospyros lotus]